MSSSLPVLKFHEELIESAFCRCTGGERNVAGENVRGYVTGLHSSRLGAAEIL